jgi:hypothetical protein
MTVLKNSLNEAVLWANATTTFVIAGNSSVSNVCFTNQANVSQNVAGASIRKIIIATVNNSSQWEVKRGANQVWIGGGNYTFDFAAHNMILNQDKAANVVVTLTGGGTIMLDISKESV